MGGRWTCLTLSSATTVQSCFTLSKVGSILDVIALCHAHVMNHADHQLEVNFSDLDVGDYP